MLFPGGHLDIEIVSETLARVHYSNRTKILTAKGVDEYDVASIYTTPPSRFAISMPLSYPRRGSALSQETAVFDGAAFESFNSWGHEASIVTFPGLFQAPRWNISTSRISIIFYLQWYSRFDFQETIPVRSKTFTLRADSSFPCASRSRARQNTERGKGWCGDPPRLAGTGREAVKSEPMKPPDRDIVPHVRIYLRSYLYDNTGLDATDWNGIARWTRDLSRERQIPTEEVAAKARQLTQALGSSAKAQRVMSSSRRASATCDRAGIGGSAAHDNGSVFKNRYETAR